MSTQIRNAYIIKKIDIVEYLTTNKDDIIARLQNKNYNLATKELEFISMHPEIEPINIFAKIRETSNYEISFRLVDMGLKDHYVVIDSYGILEPLYLGNIDVNTSDDSWMKEYEKVLNDVKPSIYNQTLTNPWALYNLLDKNVFEAPRNMFVLSRLLDYNSFIDTCVIVQMILNAIIYQKKLTASLK